MNLTNYYWWFKSAIPPRICDDIVKYGLKHEDGVAITGGLGRDRDLKNSPDYIMLYGVSVKDCSVRIHYDDNRRAGRSWDIPLKHNQFIMFPSTNMYYITNNQKDSLNFILTITNEFI